MDKIEQVLRQGLQKRLKNRVLEKGPDCPRDEELSLYMEKKLNKDRKEAIEKHLSDCSYCLDLVVVAQDALTTLKKTFDYKSLLLKQKWLILCLITFVLSFLFPRYFLQFLVATLILGIKWAVGPEGAKNLVMIFRSMHAHEEAQSKDSEFKVRR